MLNSVLSVPDANPSPTSGDRTDAGDGNWTHGRSGEAQTDPAAVGFAASCSQMSEARASQWRGAGLCPPALPNHEERPQPHDALSSWEGLSRWAHVAEAALTNKLCVRFLVCLSAVCLFLSRGSLDLAQMSAKSGSVIQRLLSFSLPLPSFHFQSLPGCQFRKQNALFAL